MRRYPRDLDPYDVEAYEDMMADFEAEAAAEAQAAVWEMEADEEEPIGPLFTLEWGMDSSATAPDRAPIGHTPASGLDEDLPF